MFKGKKQDPVNQSSGISANPNASNIINTGTKIDGNISSDGDIRIDGTLIGELTCRGKVIIGPEGMVEGTIECQNAVIEGTFKGDLACSELLNVRESAKINGDIRTEKLIVQSGAMYNVTCKMGSGGIKSISEKSAAAS